MIKLKPRPALPPTLASDQVRAFAESLKSRVDNGGRLHSKDYNSKYWQQDDVKNALFSMHSGKCCYCERNRDEKREPDVEHFRPKAGITEDPNHSGYWWLAYDWNNYFFSCKKCNQEHKKNQFPLISNNSRACSPNDNLQNEKPFLINPEIEDPENYIGFEWYNAYGLYVKAFGIDSDDRGNRTIKITGINLGTIPEERAAIVDLLDHIVETLKWALREGNQNTIDRTAIN